MKKRVVDLTMSELAVLAEEAVTKAVDRLDRKGVPLAGLADVDHLPPEIRSKQRVARVAKPAKQPQRDASALRGRRAG